MHNEVSKQNKQIVNYLFDSKSSILHFFAALTREIFFNTQKEISYFVFLLRLCWQ